MSTAHEIAAASAMWVLDHGLDYAAARRKATEQLGLAGLRGVTQPDDAMLEDAIREHLSVYGAEEQAQELRVLRRLALQWMQRLTAFEPHLGGAVWRGTATRHSPILIDVYSDDPTAPEIALLNQGVRYDTGERPVARGRDSLPLIGIQDLCAELSQHVPIEIAVHPLDDLRGALRADANGRTWRGPAAAVARLLEQEDATP